MHLIFGNYQATPTLGTTDVEDHDHTMIDNKLIIQQNRKSSITRVVPNLDDYYFQWCSNQNIYRRKKHLEQYEKLIYPCRAKHVFNGIRILLQEINS